MCLYGLSVSERASGDCALLSPGHLASPFWDSGLCCLTRRSVRQDRAGWSLRQGGVVALGHGCCAEKAQRGARAHLQ